jgi:hypothetical protein
LTKEEKKAKFKLENEKINNYIKEINKYFGTLDIKINSNLIKLKNLVKIMIIIGK